jgi:hypothetical protein
MMIALDVAPWTLPAMVTILMRVGVMLRRHHHAEDARVVLWRMSVPLGGLIVMPSLSMAVGAIA